MANIPEDLHYSKDHEWIRVEGGTGTGELPRAAAERPDDDDVVGRVVLDVVGESARKRRAERHVVGKRSSPAHEDPDVRAHEQRRSRG